MQGSRALWRAHRTPGAALGSGDDQHQHQHHQHQPRPTTSIRANRDAGKHGVEADADARAAAEALALASEPTIEKMVPIPNHVGHEQQQQQQQQQQQPGEGMAEQGYSRPDASLVARGALKSGYLWKMGANVPRWKRRFFVLKPITMLFYYMSEHDTEPRGCIDLDLFDAVRKVREDDEDGVGGCREAEGFSAGGGGGKRRRGGGGSSPSATTFELYRSGCPDGSGFMLEARGDEDWEQWVESIANGRHGKMRAEMDVMRGANKLLLEEISGLEQQVATFRGYADQRHVTVLALRDERHRNREVATELAALADTASALSHLISQSVKDDQQQEQQQQRGVAVVEEADAAQHQHHHRAAWVDAAAEEDSSTRSKTAREDDFDFARPPPSPPPPPQPDAYAQQQPPAVDDYHHHNQELSEQIAEERLSFEAVRRALAEARAELGRKGRALRQETDRRQAVEGRVQCAEGAARAAEKRAEAAEAATARANGRVSVLERNVEYLQTQQRALRAELCQAQHKTQLVRAQKAVLKREVGDMWARHTSSPSSRGSPHPDQRGPPSKHHHQRQQAGGARGQGGSGPHIASLRCRARTWASMGDLAEADVAPHTASGGVDMERGGGGDAPSLSTRPSDRRQSMTGASTSSSSSEVSAAVAVACRGRRLGLAEALGGKEEDERAGTQSIRSRQRGGSMRSCLSGEGLAAAASDGGETDFADRTNSEASDLEDESTRVCGHSAHETSASGNGSVISSPFRESVCRTIRKRAGPPQVPPLPPTRHGRTLTAVKRLRAFSDNNSAEATQQVQQQQQQQPEGTFGGGGGIDASGGGDGSGGFGAFAVGGGGSGGGPSSAVAGLGVAGMFLGLRKGMVDKAAQEMGKKLALWPGAGMPSVSSLGSLAAGALSGATGGSGSDNNSAIATAGHNNAAESGAGMGGVLHPQTPVGSPRSASASFSTALTDSPVRWDPPSRHGSTASTEPGSDSAPVPVAAPEDREGEADDCSATPAKEPHYLAPASGVAASADVTSTLPAAVGGGGLPRIGSVPSRTALIQLSDLELAEPCGRRIVGGAVAASCGSTTTNGGDAHDGGGDSSCGSNNITSSSPQSSLSAARSTSTSASASASVAKRRLSLLPPRPDDEYELVFTSRVIGLQFKELPDGTGVYVAGSDGYVGPAPATTGVVPGERLCPDNGDILESYNGISARGKAADVVAGELAQCGRPLRLGFRAARAEAIAEESDEDDEGEGEDDEVAWAAAYGGGRAGGAGGGGGGPWGGGAEAAGAGGGGSSCRDDAVAFAEPSHPWAVSS